MEPLANQYDDSSYLGLPSRQYSFSNARGHAAEHVTTWPRDLREQPTKENRRRRLTTGVFGLPGANIPRAMAQDFIYQESNLNRKKQFGRMVQKLRDDRASNLSESATEGTL